MGKYDQSKEKKYNESKDPEEKFNDFKNKQVVSNDKANDNFGGYVLYDDDEYMNSLGMFNNEKKSKMSKTQSQFRKTTESKGQSQFRKTTESKSRGKRYKPDDFELPENWEDDNRQDLDKSGLNASDLNNESIRLGKLQVDESMRKTNSTLKKSNKNSSKD